MTQKEEPMPIEVVEVDLIELRQRYATALHAVQSGVKTLMEMGDDLASPKHLRVGVNSAHVTDLAVARLLIAKGVVTEREYAEAVAVAMEEEKASLEKHLSANLGIAVKLR